MVIHSNWVVSWEDLIENTQHKINNWTFRALNFLSHLTLLKVVLQVIPNYQLAVMSIPSVVAQRFHSL